MSRQDAQHGPGDETVRLPAWPGPVPTVPQRGQAPPALQFSDQTIQLPKIVDPPATAPPPSPALQFSDQTIQLPKIVDPPPPPPPPPPAPPPPPPRPAAAPESPAPPGRGRRGLIAVLAVVAPLALVGAGVAVVRPGPVTGWLGETAAASPSAAPTTPEPEPSPVLAAASTDAPAPTVAGLKAALDPVVAKSGLGGRTHLSVVDVATGEALYSRSPTTATVPASTTKLATAAAVLAARGPAYRIETRVVAGDKPGEVVIVGGGDPTLAVGATGTYPGAGRLDELAKQVKEALGGTAPTKVIIDATLFTGPTIAPSWDSDVPTGGFGAAITALTTNGARLNPKQYPGYAKRSGAPDLAAGQAFAKALGVSTKAVRGKAPVTPETGGATPTPGGTPAPGTVLGTVQSPPVLRLVEFMLIDSDNVVAEYLARQVAIARGQPVSYTGGAAATLAVLAELGLPTTGAALSDGSGLSRQNRLTAALLTDLLRLAASDAHPELVGVIGGLPVAAWSGTLRDRYRTSAAVGLGAGVVRAKTGTLSGVNSISGVLVTADGRLLAFAVLADKVPLSKDQAEVGLDSIATALAACGCS